MTAEACGVPAVVATEVARSEKAKEDAVEVCRNSMSPATGGLAGAGAAISRRTIDSEAAAGIVGSWAMELGQEPEMEDMEGDMDVVVVVVVMVFVLVAGAVATADPGETERDETGTTWILVGPWPRLGVGDPLLLGLRAPFPDDALGEVDRTEETARANMPVDPALWTTAVAVVGGGCMCLAIDMLPVHCFSGSECSLWLPRPPLPLLLVRLMAEAVGLKTVVLAVEWLLPNDVLVVSTMGRSSCASLWFGLPILVLQTLPFKL